MTPYATVRFQIHHEIRTDSVTDIAQLFHDEGMTGQAQECLWVVALDNANRIRSIVEVARGGYHDLAVSIPSIISAVLLAATDRFVVVHNHPSGDCTPSSKDVKLTLDIARAAGVMKMEFEDHLIVGPPGQHESLRDRGVLPRSQLARAAER